MTKRTTIVLDDESREALRQLSGQLDCSMSEVIRKAILRYRELSAGVPPRARKVRTRALRRLIELFDGHDDKSEIARLKAEDSGS